MTFEAPSLPPVDRPIRSLLARAQNSEPEIPAFPCVDPVETAADKLSALAWRVCARERGSPKDDPTIVRHLHDLAALSLASPPRRSSPHYYRRQPLPILAEAEVERRSMQPVAFR